MKTLVFTDALTYNRYKLKTGYCTREYNLTNIINKTKNI